MMEEMDLAGTKVHIVSVGGAETCIYVPSARLCLDMGRCFPQVQKVPTVFFTHVHGDHIAGLIPHALSRKQKGWDVPTYYVPEESHRALLGVLGAWERMSSQVPCEVKSLRPGAVVDHRNGLEVRTFRAIHTRPSLGYALTRPNHRLKAEFRGMEGRELKALKDKGVAIMEDFLDVHLAFCGDTTIDVLKEPLVKSAKALILECTFLDDELSQREAREGGHVHIRDVVDHLDELTNDHEVVLFTHPSQRHLGRNIERMYERYIPDWRERGFKILQPPPEWRFNPIP